MNATRSLQITRAILVLGLAALIGAFAGYAWRRSQTSPADSAQPEVATQTMKAAGEVSVRSAPAEVGAATVDSSPLATQLARDLAMSEGVTRWLYWMEAIEKATLTDLPRLARLAYGNPTAIRLVGARWYERSPRHLFDTLLAMGEEAGNWPRAELTSILFEDWPKRDPDGLIAAMNSPGAEKAFRSWRASVADRVMRQDVERGLTLLSQWNVQNFLPRLDSVGPWAALDPQHAAEFTLAHPAGYATENILGVIAKTWAVKDPARALDFAAQMPGGFRSGFTSSVLREWAGHNLEAAADWLAASPELTRAGLSSAFVEAWAKSDVSGALAWSEANLSGDALAGAVGAALKTKAASDLPGAARLVSAMPPSVARREAAAVVAEKWFPEYASHRPVNQETLDWLTRLDPASRNRALDRVGWRWAELDPKGMAGYLAAQADERSSSENFATAARAYTRQDPAAAMDWAGHLPVGVRTSVEERVFDEWGRWQPDAATHWLGSLPADDPRRPQFFSNMLQALAFDPHGPERMAALGPAERSLARKLLRDLPVPLEQRQRLINALPPD